MPTGKVSIDGEIVELWPPSDSAIAQVGLIADDTGKIKWTSWKASKPAFVQEGETVRMRYLN